MSGPQIPRPTAELKPEPEPEPEPIHRQQRQRWHPQLVINRRAEAPSDVELRPSTATTLAATTRSPAHLRGSAAAFSSLSPHTASALASRATSGLTLNTLCQQHPPPCAEKSPATHCCFWFWFRHPSPPHATRPSSQSTHTIARQAPGTDSHLDQRRVGPKARRQSHHAVRNIRQRPRGNNRLHHTAWQH
ncbi:hypothetical protein BX661DRAFT_64250 [Kickxella alabastrina]|uniref:uncharacterized protein n=1 Tax=Kickxella alabastrina TaxID=61397 RepID=UPI00221E6909|nr:uncharacterized protein BX661DRAFT_64250 [Kickxella alabastrina]KAI7833701.1 hypothetical protein BX661DRAFT_64250 [Kickxella alabastrina]